jgi:NhaA family Na+:H+ antiporter
MKSSKSGALNFLEHEAAGVAILLAAAALALVLDNSPLSIAYESLLKTPVAVRVGELAIDKPLLLWINDGLMAIFFFLIGLEIKREMLEGELSTLQQASLPLFAAVGGMAVPALIYVLINWHDASALDGWAIPSATDIAFSVGVLTLLGPRVPTSLKVFLLALAIIDDLGAIIIIAVFYTSKLSVLALALAFAGIAGLIALNLGNVTRSAAYAIVGVFIWVCVLKSGVHATLAGVAVALAIPLNDGSADGTGPLERMEHALHPWVTFAILPLFGFANAGVTLPALSLDSLFSPIPLGIAAGLFVGKPLGVMLFVGAAVLLGLAKLPDGARWLDVLGVSVLTGIGFTMSLFIGTLAFDSPQAAADVRIGVLCGSLLAAAAGYLILRMSLRPAA